MQETELLSGYLDLLTQFKIRTRTHTAITELQIMFWLTDYDLVIDEEYTGCEMVIAIYSPRRKKWIYELLPGSPARKMIQYFCELLAFEEVPGTLNYRLVFKGSLT